MDAGFRKLSCRACAGLFFALAIGARGAAAVGEAPEAGPPEPGAAAVGAGAATRPSSAVPLPTGANVVVIPVRGFIYDYTLESLKRRAEHAVRAGASLIVIELDTPGGLVHSALKISRYIKTLPVRTVAWVNDEALSAGILIASACGQIVMSPASMVGDCAPIVPGQNLAPTERAKALSPILEEFRDSAQANGYDFALFHAMCVLGIEVYKIRDPDSGRTMLVNQADYRVMVEGAAPDGGWLGRLVPGPSGGSSATGGVGVATVGVATKADRGRWELVSKIHDGKTLLTLNQTRAFEAGLSANDAGSDPIATTGDLRRYLGAASVARLGPSTVSQVAYWLTQPWVRAILVVVFLLGAYLEAQAPGIGVAGLSALVALTLLIGAPFLVGLAQVWHVLLFFVGVLLLLGEVFLLPGFGVLGISGIVCMFAGLVLMVVPSTGQGPLPLPASEMTHRLQQSVLSTLVGVIASAVALFYIMKHVGALPVLRRLVLRSPVPSGAVVAGGGGVAVSSGVVEGERVGVGSVGTTVTKLRPTGRAEFGGALIDVVSQGEWIEPGRRVRVVELCGNRVVVEAEAPPGGADRAG